ncbi:MAG: LUD domain-containing protein [Haloarculaceae archaeon]|jgi:L-lactate dehydrogenase complex protein LldG
MSADNTTADDLSRFTAAAERVDATVTHAPAADAEDVLADAIDEPATGVELDIEGVSLSDLPVTLDPTGAAVTDAATGITQAALGIADYGSVVIRETSAGEEPVSLFGETHIAVVAASDIVPDMPTAFERFGEWMRTDGTDAVIATGPSATADMGALVKGAHGPRAVHIVVVEDR